MTKQKLKPIAAAVILTLTIAAFAYYFVKHPSIGQQLRHMNPWLLVALLALYGVFTLAYVLIQAATLQVLRLRIPLKENALLTSYSFIANFFGPLQSGPGVRLVYLKRKYHINIKNYIFATFLYYGFFALFSGIFLTIHVLRWWQTLLVVGAIVAGSFYVIMRKRRTTTLQDFSVEAVVNLALATLFQVLLVAVIYFIELHSINTHITFAQAITYTGAANFALFVSLTPGAIGFRESFLLFSQHLHHIDSSQVLAASVIDRSVNIAFLGLLFLVTLAVHARDRLRLTGTDAVSPPDHRE